MGFLIMEDKAFTITGEGRKLIPGEYPLLVIPSLAEELGLDEAVFLQQLHYWIRHYEDKFNKHPDHIHEDYMWVYNSYDDWHKQMPWWSVSTIRRIVKKLRTDGWIITGNFNKWQVDKTLWYRINHIKVQEFIQK